MYYIFIYIIYIIVYLYIYIYIYIYIHTSVCMIIYNIYYCRCSRLLLRSWTPANIPPCTL